MGSATDLKWQKKEPKTLGNKSIEMMQSKEQEEQRFKTSGQNVRSLGTASNTLACV